MNRNTRRRLDSLQGFGQNHRGMGRKFWSDQKKESERRMAIIDDAPREWRDLVNTFDPDRVADLAGAGYGADMAAFILRTELGKPL